MTLEELYDRAAVVASMRQARFAEQIGDHIWWVDPQNCVAQLYTRERTPSEKMPIRMLGTEGGGEWLWAWGNALNFPLPWTRDFSKQLCERGLRSGAAEFTEARLAVDDVVNARTFATIALAQPETAGYVLHRAGPLTAAFVVGEPYVTPDETDMVAIGMAISNVLGGAEPFVNAHDVIVGTFETLAIPHTVDGELVTARDGLGGSITLGIENGRFLCKIEKPGAN